MIWDVFEDYRFEDLGFHDLGTTSLKTVCLTTTHGNILFLPVSSYLSVTPPFHFRNPSCAGQHIVTEKVLSPGNFSCHTECTNVVSREILHGKGVRPLSVCSRESALGKLCSRVFSLCYRELLAHSSFPLPGSGGCEERRFVHACARRNGREHGATTNR